MNPVDWKCLHFMPGLNWWSGFAQLIDKQIFNEWMGSNIFPGDQVSSLLESFYLPGTCTEFDAHLICIPKLLTSSSLALVIPAV